MLPGVVMPKKLVRGAHVWHSTRGLARCQRGVLAGGRTRVGNELTLDVAQRGIVLVVRAELRGRGGKVHTAYVNEATEHFTARRCDAEATRSVVAVADGRNELATGQL